jgi:hypothetical protein
MNRIGFLSLVVFAAILTTCSPEPGFDFSVIPGTYKGSLYYFTSAGADKPGVSVPAMSKTSEFRTVVTLDGSQYLFTFDNSFKYQVPETEVEVFSIFNGNTASIRTKSGQSYSSSSALNSTPGQPANYISDDTNSRKIRCELTLKSNDPDSAYFLNFTLFRDY